MPLTENEIRCMIEDAWVEFERTGELSNSASNLLSVVEQLTCELIKSKMLIIALKN